MNVRPELVRAAHRSLTQLVALQPDSLYAYQTYADARLVAQMLEEALAHVDPDISLSDPERHPPCPACGMCLTCGECACEESAA